MMIMIFGGLVLPLSIKIFFYSRIWFTVKTNEFFLAYSAKMIIKSDVNNKNENEKYDIKLDPINEENDAVLLNRKSLISTKNSQTAKVIRNEIKLLKSIILIIVMFCIAW